MRISFLRDKVKSGTRDRRTERDQREREGRRGDLIRTTQGTHSLISASSVEGATSLRVFVDSQTESSLLPATFLSASPGHTSSCSHECRGTLGERFLSNVPEQATWTVLNATSVVRRMRMGGCSLAGPSLCFHLLCRRR
uniref:Uncharacterized protein n=1 Tax=Toxoplasma gondii COUG TaxID=1074873 RepID=A0A2G8Y578_TOXGO|nr:hypothetical protein TGCOUG_392590 [Toxoplasma gondii COUG]